MMVLFVYLEMFSEFSDSRGENRNLDLRRSCVCRVLLVIQNKLAFDFFLQCHFVFYLYNLMMFAAFDETLTLTKSKPEVQQLSAGLRYLHPKF